MRQDLNVLRKTRSGPGADALQRGYCSALNNIADARFELHQPPQLYTDPLALARPRSATGDSCPGCSDAGPSPH